MLLGHQLSEVATEIICIASVLKLLGQVDTLIDVNVDNIGAIYWSPNASSGNYTKQIDTMYHSVREYTASGIFKVKYVRPEESPADIPTKNTNVETFNKWKGRP